MRFYIVSIIVFFVIVFFIFIYFKPKNLKMTKSKEDTNTAPVTVIDGNTATYGEIKITLADNIVNQTIAGKPKKRGG